MFLGEFRHQLDEKGRVSVPAKFRDHLKKKGAIITKGLDGCLFLFPATEWKKIADKITQLTIFKADARAISRHLFSSASEVEFDKQGRILIPDYLRKSANLKKSVVFAGVFNRIEIWSEDEWNRYQCKTDKQSGQIAERMSDINI